MLKLALLGIVAAGLVAAAPAAPAARAAEPVLLRFASPAPRSDIMTLGFEPWVQNIMRDSAGGLDIKTLYSVVDHRHAYDSAINGVVDMSWVIMGPYPGQFPRTDVASLPFEGGGGYSSAVALWRLFDRGVISEEYGKIKLLGLFVYPSSGFHTNKPVKTLADLKGLKLGMTGRALSELTVALGGTPVTMTPADWYQALQRGLIGGVLTAWPGIHPYKLDEVTKYHLDGAFGRVPAFVFMNKSAFAALPENARKVIDQDSGEKLSAHMGTVIDGLEAQGRDHAKSLGHDVYELAPDEAAVWRQRASPIMQKWVEGTPGGAKILAAYRAEYQATLKSR